MNTSTRYQLAGGLSLAMAVLGIPMVVLAAVIGRAAQSGAISGLASRSMTAALSVASYAIGIYVYAALRHLFETRHGFPGASGPLRALITLSVAMGACTILGVASAHVQMWGARLSLLSLVAFGILDIVIGLRVLRAEIDLSGLRKPYACTTLAGGICYATILLFPIGILVSVASGILVALIFFRESSQLRAAEGCAGK
ncbi:MAG: hypothetical protein EOM72_08385 [Opitutae bacterium]|nr:hypothetical protein [Opitutae bacterium]